MGKSDHKYVSTDKREEYELEDWLKRNDFSSGDNNIKELNKIIDEKVRKKKGDNITWDELDNALKNNPEWFSSLTKPESKS
ncbi:hypothetical protein HV284_24745 (plasmid) [Escherichia marmotae]|uniref:Uncharacterized protein n=1 Tax=Escherichia marmotae TaxID=1499973 RepID=A0A7H9KHD4_9ESCH|nr:hypothetical protein [Escherichia marmotae]MDQ9311010.1 hypothetical protein [Escherichia marmotae]QLV04267.1 hypothetical protein HV284_24745 [Escherichia marmotae]